MFQLEAHEACISNLNSRIERNGDERALAADVKFTTSASNSVLDQFGPGLKEAFFRKPTKGEQPDLPNIGGSGLSAVKFPSLEPLKLAHELTGYELQIDGLLEGTEPIVLVDVKLKRFVFEPKEGGSVELSFTASANVDADELAELAEALVREDVRLTLKSPAKVATDEHPQQQLSDAA